ncbi:MAG: hypothetical protein GWN86_04050 [Desulfobacterales bacterium]|nr:hypothetical protein [Desulfobacterales bacterium]
MLVLIRRKAWRKKVWYKALSRVERGLVSLTIRCVDRVQSSKLAVLLNAIVKRLEIALESRVKRLMEEVGRPLARRISRIAQDWGHKSALKWTGEEGFVRYLTIMSLPENRPP